MEDNICKILGANIKKYRKLKNVTQEKLAELIGVEVRSLSLIETGRNFISSKTLAKLANVLNVTPSDLFFEDGSIDTETVYNNLLEGINKLKKNPAKLRIANSLINELL